MIISSGFPYLSVGNFCRAAAGGIDDVHMDPLLAPEQGVLKQFRHDQYLVGNRKLGRI